MPEREELTPAQKEVLTCMAQLGARIKGIRVEDLAAKIPRSTRTILYHLCDLMEKGYVRRHPTTRRWYLVRLPEEETP